MPQGAPGAAQVKPCHGQPLPFNPKRRMIPLKGYINFASYFPSQIPIFFSIINSTFIWLPWLSPWGSVLISSASVCFLPALLSNGKKLASPPSAGCHTHRNQTTTNRDQTTSDWLNIFNLATNSKYLSATVYVITLQCFDDNSHMQYILHCWH